MVRLRIALMLALSMAGLAWADSEYVGAERCARCHEVEAKAWRGSHHDRAMAEATGETVLGDFNDATVSAHGITSRFYRKDSAYFVRTDGPDGKLRDYRVRYTFGWYPLQQYLIEFPNGHVQALGLAWDSRPAKDGGQRWFHLYPGEKMSHEHPLHWTGRDQTWNYQCAECHSTNLRRNYDAGKDAYRTLWAEINVACEACHGPGGAHAAWAEARAGGKPWTGKGNGLVVDLKDRDGAGWLIDGGTGKPRRAQPRADRTQVELCARCHSRRGLLSEDYRHGRPLMDTHRPALLEESLYFPDGQIKDEVYAYGSFIQSRMFHAGVVCADCHEPHSLRLRGEGDAVCGRCHARETYAAKSHHRHPQGAKGVTCVSCHAPQRTYMVIDERADHSFRVPRPDLSARLGTPNACNQCHRDKSAKWAADAARAWHGTARRPHFGEALHAAQRNAPDAADRLTALIDDATQPAIARATAIDLLGPRMSPALLPVLKRQLADPDPLVRASAVRRMEAFDWSVRVDALWPLLEDPVRGVRLEAARLLAPLTRGSLPPQFKAQLEPAIDEYVSAMRATADRPESHLNLGLLFAGQARAAEAEEAYRAALRLDPRFAPAYVNLADLYRAQRRDRDGEKVLRDGIARLPDSADLHHALGLLLVRDRRQDLALASLRRANALAPGNTRYAYVYGVALDGAGRTAAALPVLRDALRRAPADRSLLSALAEYSLKAGDRRSAIAYAERLVRAAPDDREARKLLESVRAGVPPG